MISFFIDGKESKLGVNFYGDNFTEIKDVLKSFAFIWKPDGFDGRHGLWVKSIDESTSIHNALKALADLEPIRIPDRISGLLDVPPETERFRVHDKPDDYVLPPIQEYQKNAILRTAGQSRMLLALKQGLGKTYIIVTALNILHDEGLVDKVMILCRPEGVYNFKRELFRFSNWIKDESQVYVADADNREPFSSKADVVMMTYRTFLMISDDGYKKSKGKSATGVKYKDCPIEDDIKAFGLSRALVLDESHSVMNKGARWTRAVALASHMFRFRYLLTGTPYPHGVDNLWSQFNIMDSRVIGEPYFEWLKEICKLGTRFSDYAITGYREDVVKIWVEKMSPWIIREFTEDNIKLPPQIVKRTYFEMSEKQRAIYQNFISYVMVSHVDDHGTVVMREVYNQFPMIQQALVEPLMLKGKVSEETNPKLYRQIEGWRIEDDNRIHILDSLLEEYCDIEGKKVIVWSSHPLVMDILETHLKKYNPVKVHGQIPIPSGKAKTDYIDSLVEEFKKNPKRKVLLASLLMLATSQNIVEAPRAIYFDRTWNFTDLDQSIKRNHRIGTTEPVIVNFLIAEKSLDIRLDNVLARRSILDQDLTKFDSLSAEQWKALFEGKDL